MYHGPLGSPTPLQYLRTIFIPQELAFVGVECCCLFANARCDHVPFSLSPTLQASDDFSYRSGGFVSFSSMGHDQACTPGTDTARTQSSRGFPRALMAFRVLLAPRAPFSARGFGRIYPSSPSLLPQGPVVWAWWNIWIPPPARRTELGLHHLFPVAVSPSEQHLEPTCPWMPPLPGLMPSKIHASCVRLLSLACQLPEGRGRASGSFPCFSLCLNQSSVSPCRLLGRYFLPSQYDQGKQELCLWQIFPLSSRHRVGA